MREQERVGGREEWSAGGRRAGGADSMTAESDAAVQDLRCDCGSLAARVVDGKLELKCRRCQRIGLLDLGRALQGGVVEISWHGDSRRAKAK